MKAPVKLLFLLLTVSGWLCVGPSSSAQEPALWQNNWQKFGESIAPYAREGVLESPNQHYDKVIEFNQIFGQKVEWEGTLTAVRSYERSASIEIEMQPMHLPLQDGSVVKVSRLSLSCYEREGGCERWSADLIGKKVRFRTELENRTHGVQPVVRVHGKGRDNERVEIETSGAEFVRVVSE